MEYKQYYRVSANEEFPWELLSEKINTRAGSKIQKIEGNQVLIESINRTTEGDIIKLSEENPDYLFETEYWWDDPFENIVTTYVYQNGSRKFIMNRYKYFFEINDKIVSIDPELYSRFQKMVTNYFSKFDDFPLRTSKIDPSIVSHPAPDGTHSINSTSNFSLIYREGPLTLIAKKFGLTYIDVSVEVKGRPKRRKSVNININIK